MKSKIQIKFFIVFYIKEIAIDKTFNKNICCFFYSKIMKSC